MCINCQINVGAIFKKEFEEKDATAASREKGTEMQRTKRVHVWDLIDVRTAL